MMLYPYFVTTCHFNPRPPRGGRPRKKTSTLDKHLFQSTPPARGATVADQMQDQSASISIHAPREGGDLWFLSLAAASSVFQSTPPARGATSDEIQIDYGI